MADSIPGVGGRPLTSIKAEQLKNDVTKVKSEENGSTSNVISLDTDKVELSADAKAELNKAGFDTEKVERIKQAIADGNYPIDSDRIAKGFADIEKLL